jgi:hypothetical protein
MKSLIHSFSVLILFSIFQISVYSQCGCGGAAIGGITPVGGTSNLGLLKKHNFRANIFYSYSYGKDYYHNDIPIPPGEIRYFSSNYLDILLGYGVTEKLTIDANIGYFLDKTQDFYYAKYSDNGFSQAIIYAKYNVLRSRANEIELTLGLGGKIPLGAAKDSVPQHIQPTTGAFGVAFQAFLHKGYEDFGLHFILLSRFDYNAANKNDYQYGMSFVNSLFVTKSLFDIFTFIFEFRTETRLRDAQKGELNKDSGGTMLSITPQLNYSFRNINISLLSDYPIYKFLFGNQLSKDYLIGINFTWQINLEN